MAVHVRDLPSYHVACMRYVGPYGAHGIPELWARLRTWLAAHPSTSKPGLTLGVAHDDPSITAPEQCRYDACVVVPDDFRPDALVDVVDIPAGRCAVAEFVGTAHEIQGAWDRVFGAWLPSSGYQPDDRPCFELYRGNPTVDTKAGTFRCELPAGAAAMSGDGRMVTWKDFAPAPLSTPAARTRSGRTAAWRRDSPRDDSRQRES